jgi:phage terminase small subunit
MAEPNDKQKAFAKEYLVDLNATQAAIRAGYSTKSARRIGYQLLHETPHIAALIQVGMSKRAERLEITTDRVLQEIAKLSFSDIRQLFDENGNLRPIHDLPDNAAAAISGIEIVTKIIPGVGDGPASVEYVHKIKTWDKKGSLELLGKHLKLFVECHEHTGKDGAPLLPGVILVPLKEMLPEGPPPEESNG